MADVCESDHINPPWNFSWVIKNKLCASGWPETRANVAYIRNEGVGHIVSLSEDMQPPQPLPRDPIKYHLIPVEEFEPPTLDQIDEFMNICEQAHQQEKPVLVHCRQGLGRTGVMLACYLVKFCKQHPLNAVSKIRQMRYYSIETYDQEKMVRDYRDHLEWSQP